MKYYVLTFLVLIILASLFVFKKTATTTSTVSPTPSSIPSAPVSKEAKFRIITNGTTRIFNDPKYHNLSEDVYIEKISPTTVRVRKDNITWSDFFKTLPMSLDKKCLVTGTKQTFCTNDKGTLKFFINDVEDPDALDKEIGDDDMLLVTYK